MVDFGGWDMPVQYPAGTIEEHLRTRRHAGLFDVSHMGEIDVQGADAIAVVNYLVSNDAAKLVDGQAQYSALTTPTGTVVDDLLVYRFSEDHLLLVVNAGTTEKDWDWITSHRRDGAAQLENVSSDYCQLALQGPDAVGILQKLTDVPLADIKYYPSPKGRLTVCLRSSRVLATRAKTDLKFTQPPIKPNRSGTSCLMPETTVAIPACFPAAWQRATRCGSKPAWRCMGMRSMKTTTLLEANLGWICKLNKGDFIGRDALAKQKEIGVRERLVGFEVTERGIARDEQEVVVNGERVGKVTSGSPAPYLKKNIGMAYVPSEFANEGQEIQIDVRGKLVGAQIVKTPFYKREK